MKAFACPQCGASLEYDERRLSPAVRCHYCNSSVIVPAELRPAAPHLVSTFGDERPGPSVGRRAALAVVLGASVIAALLVILVVSRRSGKTAPPRAAVPASTPRPAPTPRPTPRPEGYSVAFSLGSEGTGNGYFKDEMGVAVDGAGNLYVSDDTLRVQKFDAAGNFQTVWSIPPQTKWYARLRRGAWASKLLANPSGDVYAVISGVVMKFDGASGEVLGALRGSDHVHDATLIPGGGLLVVSQKGADDELVLIDGSGRAARRTHRFVSSRLDKELEVAALRVGADGRGHTFAVYALGGVYGEHWYDDEDLAVFHFDPEGRYVGRFGGGGREPGQFGIPSAIAVDNRSRVYVCEPPAKLHVYADDGRYLRTLTAPHAVKSLTFDAQNNLYVAGGHQVSKLVLEEPQ